MRTSQLSYLLQLKGNTMAHTVIKEEKQVVTTQATEVIQPADLVTRFVYTVLNVIEFLLAFRFLFKLFGANPENVIVSSLYSPTQVLINPFQGIFNFPQVPGASIEWATLIAMIGYALLAYLIVELLKLISSRQA